MITISLCMIVKNEEQVLEKCLNSVKDSQWSCTIAGS